VTARIIEGGSVGHERGGGEDSAQMRVNNAFVDIGGETEVIGVYKQDFFPIVWHDHQPLP
jgi:hypothetical protein